MREISRGFQSIQVDFVHYMFSFIEACRKGRERGLESSPFRFGIMKST